ncbi:MAG: hypothetical protein M1833_003264 [Piccolia ochrophora]|nr:MAG: hypothetical protein M1833_003264 [Piccolia ochrophora]
MQQGYHYGGAPPNQRPPSAAQPAQPAQPGHFPPQQPPRPVSGYFNPQATQLPPPSSNPFPPQHNPAPVQGQWNPGNAPPPPRQQQWHVPAPPPSAPPGQSSFAHPPPPPPPPPPPSQPSSGGYNPGSYGPMPGAHQTPTSPLRYDAPGGVQWTIPSGQSSTIPGHPSGQSPGLPPGHLPSHQQPGGHMSGAQAPPLPPRAPSAPVSPRFQQPSYAPSTQSHPPQHQQAYQPQSTQVNFSQPVTSNVPTGGIGEHGGPLSHQHAPNPPPLPHGYQEELRQNQQASPQHPPYSHLPPTHRYDPQYQQTTMHAPLQQSFPPSHQSSQGPSTIPSKQHSVAVSGYPSQRPPQHQPTVDGQHPPSTYASTPDVMPSAPPRLPPSVRWSSNTGEPPADPGQQQMYLQGGPPVHPTQHNHAEAFQRQDVPTQVQRYPATSPPRTGTPSSPPARVGFSQPAQSSSPPVRQEYSQQPQQHYGQVLNQGMHRPSAHIPQQNANPGTTTLSSAPPPNTVQSGFADAPGGNNQNRMSMQSGHVQQSSHVVPQVQPSHQHGWQGPQQSHHAGASQAFSHDVHNHEYSAANRPRSPSPILFADSSERPASSTKDETKTPGPGISASALGGFGGPSDWEHFGASAEDESLDDIDLVGGKKPDAIVSELAAELPSGPTPPPSERPLGPPQGHGFVTSDSWPTPPPPEPLKPVLPAPIAAHASHDTSHSISRTEYSPTPPPTREDFDSRPSVRESVVSAGNASLSSESQPNIDSTIHAWEHQPSQNYAVESEILSQGHSVTAPATREASGAQHLNAEPASSQSFVINDSAGFSTAPRNELDVNAGPQQNVRRTLEQPASGSAALAGLDKWYQDSLERYASMLHKEAQASTDEERTKLFTEFMMQESRLRGVRYGSGIGSRPGSSAKETSAPVDNHEPEIILAPIDREPVPDARKSKKSPPGISTVDSYVIAHTTNNGTNEAEYSPGGRPLIQRDNAQNNAEYSPGGRPVVRRDEEKDEAEFSPGGRPVMRPPASERQPRAESQTNRQSRAPKVPPSRKMRGPSPPPIGRTNASQPDSPGRNAPIAIQSSVVSQTPAERSRPGSPILTPPLGEQNQPQYLPFRYNDKSPQPPSQPAKAAYQPYSPPLALPPVTAAASKYQPYQKGRDSEKSPSVNGAFIPRRPSLHQSLTSRSDRSSVVLPQRDSLIPNDVPEGLRPHRSSTPSAGSGNVGDGTPPNRSPHSADRTPRSLAPVPKPPPQEQDSASLSQQLRDILPANRGPKAVRSQHVATVRRHVEALPDEFGFVDDLHSVWEKDARRARQENEKARRKRQDEQEEQEDHHQQLFAENQIGYGDLKDLEENFKNSELEKQASEDSEEFQTYTDRVFTPVYSKLQDQIAILMDQYVYCIDLMKRAVAGKDALEANNDRPDLAQIMDVFLDIDGKLEERQGRVVEAISERDKRCRTSVLRPLYASGNVTKMKEMEKHFDLAERTAAHEAAKKKLERANRLMDAIEQNTMRGVGADLDYMEAISQAISKIASVLPAPSPSPAKSPVASSPTPPPTLRNDLSYARTVLSLLTNTAETLMNSFHHAACAVNAAEHDVALAATRLSATAAADAEAVKRVQAERKKEDERLAQELKHRVFVVRDDYRKIERRVEDLLKLVRDLDDEANVSMTPRELKSGDGEEERDGDAGGGGDETGAEAETDKEKDKEDKEHRERISKALEAAKRRNAGKDGV